MATFTLAEAQYLGLDDKQAGIADTIVTVAPGLGQIPFTTVSGNAFAFNRELTLVDGQYIAADGTITDSSALTVTPVTVNLKGISGQSDINKMHIAMNIGENVGNNLEAVHTASAAKGVARKFMSDLVNGTVSANGWDGLKAMLASFSGQVEAAGGAAFTLDLVDAAMLRCSVKPTWIMGNAKAEAAFRKALRASGGVTTVELNGQYFMAYDGVIFIRNDYIPVDVDSGTTGNQTDIYFGSWDDGSMSGGLTALTTEGDLFHTTVLDGLEGKDARRVRVVLYAAATVFSPVTVSKLEAVTV